MVTTFENFANIERLLHLVAEHQSFVPPRDKLTTLIDSFSDCTSEELSEDELEFVAAARMPEIPKYKRSKKDV